MTHQRPLTSLAKLTIPCLLLAAVAVAAPASAGDNRWWATIDCYHSDYDGDAVGDGIDVEFYSNGLLVESTQFELGQNPDCTWGANDFGSNGFNTDLEIDEIRLYATSTNAWFLDHVNLERDGDSVEQWGVDNGSGWCLSEETSDGSNMPIDHDFGCQPCLQFNRGDGHAWSCPGASEAPRQYKLYETPTSATSASRILRRTWANGNIMSVAIDIAGVDHDGDGIDEIAVLFGDQDVQAVRIYEADADFTRDAPVGWWYFPFSNAMAIAGVDHDGDGVDEIAVLKAEGTDRNLYLYDAPIGLQIVKNLVGQETSDLMQVYKIAGIDHDGDGIDEIGMLMKNQGWANQTFHLYNAPIGTQFIDFVNVGYDHWNIPSDLNLDIAGIDIDGDGVDEVGVLKMQVSQNQFYFDFFVYEAPVGPEASTLLFVEGGKIPNNSKTLAITGIDHDGDGIDETATLIY